MSEVNDAMKAVEDCTAGFDEAEVLSFEVTWLRKQVAALRARVAELTRDERPRAEHPCPDCGGEVLRQDHAMDPSDYRCRDQFDCCWQSETPPPDPDADDDLAAPSVPSGEETS